MRNLFLVFGSVALIAVLGFVWLLVVAFRQRAAWGFGVLFLSPVAAVAFAITHWRESKFPFLVYINFSLACLTSMGFILVHLGGPEILTMAQEIRKGTFTEQQAHQWMNETMERIKSSGMLNDREIAKLHAMKGLFNGTKKKGAPAKPQTADSLPATTVSKVSVEPETKVPPPAPRIRPIPYGYDPITFAAAGKYIGKHLQVIADNGVEHEGVLVKATPDGLVLQKWLQTGSYSIRLRTAQILALRVRR